MPLLIRKLDLHVHTPASHDFADKSTQMKEIVEKAIKAGLDGIAVTDHNTVTGIDEIAKIAKGTQLTIFPGFEISCHGAREGPIHVIGVFGPEKRQADLERVLGKLNIINQGKESLTTKSVNDVVDIIREAGGLPVLAHANSTHGALEDIRGNPRTELVRNPSLLAVEATQSDFQKQPGTRLIDILNGEDSNYRRKLAVYSSSDNPAPGASGHSADTIGRNYTCFRMGELTIESLRQCFVDPDTRIVQAFEHEKLLTKQPRILEVSVNGGFLNGQVIDFHSGMTSIIGGTGTGKSLLVEFIRFAFNKPPQKELLKEHNAKLEKQLRNNGVVKIKFVDSAGDEYELTRTYDARKPQDSKITCMNSTTRRKYGGDVNSIFPALIYSQNEILEVTRDREAQLDLLDIFRDFEGRKREIDTLKAELHKLDRDLASSYETAGALTELKKQEQTLSEKIKKLEKHLRSKAAKEFGDFTTLEQKRSDAIERIDVLDAFKGILEESISRMEKEGEGLANELKDLQPPEKDVVAKIDAIYKRTTGVLARAVTSIQIGQNAVSSIIKSWEKTNKYTLKKSAYDKSLKTKTKLEEMDTQRQKLNGERERLKRRIVEAERADSKVAGIRGDRRGHLARLIAIRTEYFTERESQGKLITTRSGEKLRIEVQKQTNNQKYKENLLKLKVRSYAEGREVDEIVARIPVVEFVEAVLDRDARKIAIKASLTQAKAENIIDNLLRPENLAGALQLQYESFPDDQVEILYRKQDGSYHPLQELSMGQKADGLLLIALGDSQMPVIIDQPEDALDVSSIWDDVCQRLRTSKHARQFIFTTHNSSVAVASDSDQYVVMEADAKSGWVSKAGSIDQLEIKNQVIDHLEGGAKSYNLKRKKYNLNT